MKKLQLVLSLSLLVTSAAAVRSYRAVQREPGPKAGRWTRPGERSERGPGGVASGRDRRPEGVGGRGAEPEGDTPPGLAWSEDGNLALGVGLSHRLVLAGDDQDVYLYVALRAPERYDVPRLGLDLALVVDRSGSMGSQRKLEFAKAAARELVHRLRPDDRLAVVAYDDKVETLVERTPAGRSRRLERAIDGLEAGGQTDLYGGLERGFDEVFEGLDPERLTRVLLISDGLANQGRTDPDWIRERASGFRRDGVQVSTMGLGLSYDEDLLAGIARAAGGNYYYVGNVEAVGEPLEQELEELTRVVARKVELVLELADGVEAREVYGYDGVREGKQLRVRIHDLFAGQRRKVVARLRLRGAEWGTQAVLGAELRYVVAADGRPRSLASPRLAVEASDDATLVDAGRDLGVLVKVEVVHNAEVLDRAMELRKEGKVDAALELLGARYRACLRRNETEYRSGELSRMLRHLRETLEELERTRHDPVAGRDLQLLEQLKGLGYLGGD